MTKIASDFRRLGSLPTQHFLLSPGPVSFWANRFLIGNMALQLMFFKMQPLEQPKPPKMP